MRISIDETVGRAFPNLYLGLVTASHVENTQYPEALTSLIQERSQSAMRRMASTDWRDDPRLESWRMAYLSMGVNPKKHPPTAEAYIARVLKGKPPGRISAAVDAYLANELEFLLPVGGYDLAPLQGDLRLCKAAGGEPFSPLGGGPVEQVEAGEIIYRDAVRVLTRRWNYRDADTTKITAATRELILCSESVDSRYGADYLAQSVADIAALLQRFCGARTATTVVRASSGTETEIAMPAK